MSELDSIKITNPTDEDFAWRFNGEMYSIKAGETRDLAKVVAFHLAKHLSTKMIVDGERASMTKAQRADKHSPSHLKIAQLSVYDTHERRIALYKILGDQQLVIQLIQAYPFKGFIGDMDEYVKFVNKSESKPVKAQATA